MTVVGWQKPLRGAQLNRTHPLARGLVGAWIFNENTGDSIYEPITQATFDFAGTTGLPEWLGKDGLSFSGDDVSYIIENPYTSKYPSPGTGDFTIFAKLTRETYLRYAGIWSKGHYNSYSAGLRGVKLFQGNGTTEWRLGAPAISIRWIYTIETGEPFTIAVTRENGSMHAYMDGVEQTLTVEDDFSTFNFDTTEGIRIGSFDGYNKGTPGECWNGPIHAAYYYPNRALSQKEITLLHREPYCMFQPSFDIGAFEYVVSGGLSIPVAMHHYNLLRSA